MKKATDVSVTSSEIEAFRRLGKKRKNVIVRVLNRKHCLKTQQNKKKFTDKNAIGICNVNLFISQYLTPVNSKLAFN